MRRYFVLTGALSLGYGSIYTLLADLRDTYGFSETQLGVITGAGFFAGFVAQLGLARLADRGHTAVMVRTGLTVAAVGMFACALAEEYWLFVLARVGLGLGSGMAGPALRRLVIIRSGPEIGVNLGRQMAWDLGGFTLGPFLAAVLAELGGLRVPFTGFGLIFATLLVFSLRVDLVADVERPTDAGVDTGLLRNRTILATIFSTLAFSVTIGVFESVWSVLLRDNGAETWLIGVTLSLFTVPMIFLAPVGGRLAQRRGPLQVVTLSILVATACTLAYGWIEVLWILLVLNLVHAIADSFTMPGNQVALALAAPRHRLASAQGLLGAANVGTAGVVGVAAGAAYENFGASTLFTGTALVMLACLGAALALGGRLANPAPATPVPDPMPSAVEPLL